MAFVETGGNFQALSSVWGDNSIKAGTHTRSHFSST